jgi:hypothetical protein
MIYGFTMIKEAILLANRLDELGMHKEAEELEKIAIKMTIKKAGQIPAGMHRYILESGSFGASDYDELEWIRRESEKGIKKLKENKAKEPKR